MKLGDHLSDDQKRKLNRMAKKEEKVNWKELMGVNRDTYKKVNGKWRNRK